MQLRRLALISSALFTLALSACGGPTPSACGPDTCGTGCCTTDGQCVGGTEDTACGQGGRTCNVCSGGQQCGAQVCAVPLVTVADAGADAGQPPPLDAGEPITAAAETWTWVDFPDSACGNGVPTGIAINPTTRSKDVIIYMEGGGACWEGLSCFVVKSAVRIETGYTAANFANDGVTRAPFFNRGNPGNPVKDMSYVYVPYCTGDVHSGDAVRAYDAQNPTRLVHHKGRKNVEAYLHRLRATFPDAERVFVSGSSAGAFGAQLNFPQVRAAWPNAEVHVLADCAQMLNPVAGRLEDWLAAWNVSVPADCTDCTTDFPKYPAYLATKYPQSRFALLAYEEDNVLRQFFGLEAPLFKAGTLDLLTTHYDGKSNAHYFLVPGSSHVMLDDVFTLIGPGSYPLATFTTLFVLGDPGWMSVKP